jgi:hypothetical protein
MNYSTIIQYFKKIIDNWPGNWLAKQEFGKITGGPVAEQQYYRVTPPLSGTIFDKSSVLRS